MKPNVDRGSWVMVLSGLTCLGLIGSPGSAQEPKLRATLKGHTGGVVGVAFSSDGTLLASGGSDSAIIVWDVKNSKGKATLKGHNDSVTSVAFSPDSTILASGSYDRAE